MEMHEIDSHVDAHYENLTTKATTVNLCAIYTGVRPVLKFAKALLFFKPKWQTAIQALIDNLDTACPQ